MGARNFNGTAALCPLELSVGQEAPLSRRGISVWGGKAAIYGQWFSDYTIRFLPNESKI